MKVIIDGIPNEFDSIQRPSAGNYSFRCPHFECIVKDHSSAHNFNQHPKSLPKDTEIKTNGHVYVFPSKQ